MEQGEPLVLFFNRTQQIFQLPHELHTQLHELLRERALRSFVTVQQPTIINTPSWYTFDASRVITDIPDTVMVCTSTCKHEPPFQIFIGRKKDENWMKEEGSNGDEDMFKDNPNTRYIQPGTSWQEFNRRRKKYDLRSNVINPRVY